MSTYTDAEQFLQEVFGDDYGTAAILANLNPPFHTRSVDMLDDMRDCYWGVAAFAGGHVTRTKAMALEVRALVVDDVGTKVVAADVKKALGGPTAITLTSAGNYQWAYRLESPVAVADWAAFFAEIERRVGCKLEGRDAVHLFRLPMGVNTKKDRGRCAVQLVELNPGVKLKIPGIKTTNTQSVGNLSGPGPSGGSDIKLGLDDLRTFMGWIPNTFGHRQEWMDALHDIKALCEDDEDGLTVVEEWSDPEKHPGYNRAVWDKVGASGLKSTGGMLKGLAQAANPDGYAKMFAPKVFDDDAEPPPEVEPRGTVKFQRGKHKEILATKENAERGLAGLGIACSYDEFHHRIYIRGDERLTDHAVLMLRHELSKAYGKDFGSVHIGDAIMTLALLNGFNPVTDMLAEAEAAWDGVRRLDRLGPDYFHTEDTELARQCFRKVMLAAVRRARRPGCKFDQILVLESPEGWDKSTAWAVLAGEGNFSDADILGKDARAVQEELADVWIHEIADLSGLSRTDIEHVKAFASRTNDRARGAYERFLKDQPRQSIEVGTTNSDAYLLSTTGNRRFWPFKLAARVDTARLRADRLLLWGEAAAAESGGETLVLDAALWVDAAAAQEERRVIDPWEDELLNLPDGLFKDVTEFGVAWQTITNVAIHDHLGGHRGAAMNSGAGRKIAEIMRRLGWERTYLKDAVGAKVRGYRRVTDATVSVPTSVPKNTF